MDYYAKVNGNVNTRQARLSGNIRINQGGGASLPIHYDRDAELVNRPQINSIELIGDKTSTDLRLQGKMDALTVQEVQTILYNNEKRRRKS